MPAFDMEAVLRHDADWTLLQGGPVALFRGVDAIDRTSQWLVEHGYNVVDLDTSAAATGERVGVSGSLPSLPVDASRSRRAVAVSIDIAIWMGPTLLLWWRRGRPHRERDLGYKETLRRELIRAAYFVIPTALIGGTPGQLAMGLRVVEADTLQQVGWKKAVARSLIRDTPGFIVAALSAPWLRDFKRRTDIVQRGLKEIYEEHPDDFEAVRDKAIELNESANVAQACLPPLACSVLGLVYYRKVGRHAVDRWTNTKVVVAP
jgi:uncharacterized RDD family membrane protein YckC